MAVSPSRVVAVLPAGILPALRYVWHCVASSNVEVRGRQGSRASRLLEGCSEVHRRVAPPLILGGIFKPCSGVLDAWMRPRLSYQREIIRIPKRKKPERATCCPDIIPEGVVSLDWHSPEKQDGEKGQTTTKAVFVIVPGLTGHSDSYYVRNVASHISRSWPGSKIAAYNPRGRGGNILRSPFLYSAGFTEDLRYVTTQISGATMHLSLLWASASG